MNTIEDLSDKLEQAKRLKREYETIGYENFLFEYGLQELRKCPTGIYFPNKCVMDNDEFYSYVGYVANEEKRKLLEKYLNDSCLDLEFNLKTIGEAIEIIDYEYEESQIRNVSNWNEYITSDNIQDILKEFGLSVRQNLDRFNCWNGDIKKSEKSRSYRFTFIGELYKFLAETKRAGNLITAIDIKFGEYHINIRCMIDFVNGALTISEKVSNDNIEKKENWFKKTFRKIFKIGEQKNEN